MDVSERLQEWVGSSGFVPVAFVFAALAGAAHAVAPGHGKTLAAAYLVGENGRMRDAVWLGGSVAVMHTVSVLVVAIAWTFYSVSDLVRITTLTTGLQLVAGLLTLATGVWLLQRNLRRRRDGPVVHGHGGITRGHGGLVHSHGGVVHSHDHQHQHDHEHQHSHPEPGDHRPGHTTGDSTGHTMGQTTGHTIGRRPGLTVLGAAGGLVPSPTAFLVLVTGFFTGHAAFALLLVLTFGLGMAVVLSGVGLLAVQGSSLISRGARSRPALAFATRIAPMVGAVAISVVGTVIIAVSVTGLSTA